MNSCYVFVAKAARRRGGQPQPAPMQGQPPTARPRPKPPCKGATGCGQGQPEREASGARKGRQPAGSTPAGRSDAHEGSSRPRAWPVMASPQGRQSFAGPQGAVSRGQPCRQQGQRHQP
ncbi:hypothetical protein GW17_00047339 [Ensete ventricosum]|nr:hypothetical protein GW17_00047339 [Ensete ventricosum]